MSYEAGAHKSQMQILNHLLHVESAKFSDLQKSLSLDSDYVTFHINALVKEGFVDKHDTGYVLSKKGKEYANRMDTDEQVIEKQPKLSIALVIENLNGMFLAQQRLKQPYFGYWGRPTGKIRWGETMEQAAAREALEETGLTADWRIACLYHKMDFTADTNDILEDKYFIVAHGTNPKGALITEFDGGKNAWMTNKELLGQDKVFETIVELNQIITSGKAAIFEKRHTYDQALY
jgi:ADP-ribose pyrophosphatase YjhB (NUDIX family)